MEDSSWVDFQLPCLISAGVLLMSGGITHVKITQISGANLSENVAPGSIQ